MKNCLKMNETDPVILESVLDKNINKTFEEMEIAIDNALLNQEDAHKYVLYTKINFKEDAQIEFSLKMIKKWNIFYRLYFMIHTKYFKIELKDFGGSE